MKIKPLDALFICAKGKRQRKLFQGESIDRGVDRMDKKTEQKKVFLDIVQQLRQLIKIEKIQAGEKLPSERVLSERLGVGRSSVREALRSLELLVLIETRHGVGTFLASTKASARRNFVR